MAGKPEIVSLNDFVNMHREAFTPYELWLTDDLTNYLVAKHDLNESYTSIVIDVDEKNPIHSIKDNYVQLRFNGRFYIPVEDKNSKSLILKPEQWVELFKKWFDDQKLEVVIKDTATDFIKFTAIIPVLELPEVEETETGESTENEGKGNEPSEESESPEEGGLSEEASETPEEGMEKEPEDESPKESETDDEELKEFEKALGI